MTESGALDELTCAFEAHWAAPGRALDVIRNPDKLGGVPEPG
jgi:hypothetical protein